jgi:hypothetical protein
VKDYEFWLEDEQGRQLEHGQALHTLNSYEPDRGFVNEISVFFFGVPCTELRAAIRTDDGTMYRSSFVELRDGDKKSTTIKNEVASPSK